MTTQQTDIQSQVTELAGVAFEAFCGDISAMFNLEVKCNRRQGTAESFADARKRLARMTAVHSVQAQGSINGVFYFVFDQTALFVFAGSVVMLPKQKILDSIKIGGQKEADDLRDAVQEVGNLLVGAWDRTYRERLERHKHFVKTATFIGELQNAAKQNGGPSADGRFDVVDCGMRVGDFPACSCVVMFPQTLWESAPNPAEQKAAAAEQKTGDAGSKIETEPQVSSAGNASSEQTATVPSAAKDGAVEPRKQITFGGDLSAISAGDVMNPCTDGPARMKALSRYYRKCSATTPGTF